MPSSPGKYDDDAKKGKMKEEVERPSSPTPKREEQKKTAEVSSYKSFMEVFLASKDFLKQLKGDVLGPITDDKTREAVVGAALRCIFTQPQGVRKMLETKNLVHIKNNKNWQPFCQEVLEFVKIQLPTQYREVSAKSALFKRYGKFWPDCDKELSADVAKATK